VTRTLAKALRRFIAQVQLATPPAHDERDTIHDRHRQRQGRPIRVIYLSAPSGAIVSAYLAHDVHGDERRFRGDRDRDDVFCGLRPDLRERARTSAGFASTIPTGRALSRRGRTAAGALRH
jgi:hypothetical protein